MAIENNSARLVVVGLLINCGLPFVAFAISGFYAEFIFSVMEGSHNYIWLKSIKTSFPERAFSLTLSGLIALALSQIPLFFAVSKISLVRLAIFKDTLMVAIHKEGGPYRFSGLIAPLVTSIVSLVVIVRGPVDVAILCGGRACISENPTIFYISQTLIICLVYLSNLCVLIWGVAYFKLRKMK
ncbi:MULTISPECIES: hypothetical protein [Xanthomonas]|uniref:hypothetical protein n=1 Tax=Xanthomonas TaxID=338 RepID=UPI00129069D2|nr:MULTISPECIES: hypothetical protein [Xanthomonas]